MSSEVYLVSDEDKGREEQRFFWPFRNLGIILWLIGIILTFISEIGVEPRCLNKGSILIFLSFLIFQGQNRTASVLLSLYSLLGIFGPIFHLSGHSYWEWGISVSMIMFVLSIYALIITFKKERNISYKIIDIKNAGILPFVFLFYIAYAEILRQKFYYSLFVDILYWFLLISPILLLIINWVDVNKRKRLQFFLHTVEARTKNYLGFSAWKFLYVSWSWFNTIDFFRLTPRLGRVRHLGLFSFWLSLLFLPIALREELSENLLATGILMLFMFIALINILYLKIRRLNDFNLSGWWILLSGIPVVGGIWTLLIFFIPGSEVNNKFGSPPKRVNLFEWLLILTAPLTLFILCFWI